LGDISAAEGENNPFYNEFRGKNEQSATSDLVTDNKKKKHLPEIRFQPKVHVKIKHI